MEAYSNRLLPSGRCLRTAFTVTDWGNWFGYLTCRKNKGQRRENFLKATQPDEHRIAVPAVYSP